MKKPKMFICVGAQKAGTTWLNNYLAKNDLCFNYKNIKELHLWNCFYNKNLNHHRNRIKISKEELFREKSKDKLDSKRKKLLINCELYQNTFNPNKFLDKALLKCKKKGIPLCDFTPNYSTMSEANFKGMKSYIEEKFELKILFLMRDPINRIYSWLKHQKRIGYLLLNNQQQSWKVYDKYFYRNVLDDCLKKTNNFKTSFYYTASDYPKIIDNLHKVFERSQIKFFYYEELFTNESILSLCDFLEIEYKVPELSSLSNNDKNNIDISLKERIILLNKTRDIYKEMYFRYDDIPPEWGSFN